MTFELLGNLTPFLVTFGAVIVLGVGLTAYALVDLVREQRAAAPRRTVRAPEHQGARGRLALHH